MEVQYFHNACTIITTPDLRILTDPWFTGGAYDGSWFPYPAVDYDPIGEIGRVDAIWISHVHPDHYDPTFLRKYLAAYPSPALWAGNRMLTSIMRNDGFNVHTFDHLVYEATEIYNVASLVPADDPIDTTLIVAHDGLSVVNVNDTPHNPTTIERIRAIVPEPSLALLPFVGAGPFPQTLIDFDRDILLQYSGRLIEQWLGSYSFWKRDLTPRYGMPFAGQYILGGMNAGLNRARSVIDRASLPDEILPAPLATVDVATGEVSREHDGDPYSFTPVDDYAATLADLPMVWDNDPQPTTTELHDLLIAAARNQPPPEIHFEIKTELDGYHSIGTQPAYGIDIPSRYLAGLLTGRYHWDNAITGSNLRVHGNGTPYDQAARAYLNRFHI